MKVIGKLVSRSKSGKTVLVKTEQAASILHGLWYMEDFQGDGDGPALLDAVCLPSASGAIIGAWNVRNALKGGIANVNLTLDDVEDALGIR